MESFKKRALVTCIACLLATDALASDSRDEPVAASSVAVAQVVARIDASSGASAGSQQEAPSVVEADAGRRGARRAASQGPDALRRFVQRTRTIYALQYSDFAPADVR